MRLRLVLIVFFFSSRRRHTRCREVSWARRCVQETAPEDSQMSLSTPAGVPAISSERSGHQDRVEIGLSTEIVPIILGSSSNWVQRISPSEYPTNMKLCALSTINFLMDFPSRKENLDISFSLICFKSHKNISPIELATIISAELEKYDK
eukprot:TRINITY_DN15366_c0_g1_i3.p2 TRINITY_DN15366_c0_g1~~TRINITY_DN15366_c0_g1_i3.p2  ORF type:complete len:150 (-),score=35.54 TRINITY_DN15366_c0_g1_i3:89-538(-)